MTVQKLLGLLFEHLEAGEISTIEIDPMQIIIDYGFATEKYIYFGRDLLTQYNKIFNYE